MRKVIIFGNSGSGKSTLAQAICRADGLAHLDLDVIAWKPGMPPQRKPIGESKADIDAFLDSNNGWVIEGCYADLLELVLADCSEMIFLNLPVEACIENARSRPWEPHKYETREAQDANLEMLIDWISQYPHRSDTFSRSAHEALFDQFDGHKSMFTRNQPDVLSI